MAYFRRRIPYSLGADPLPEEKEDLKEKLDPEEEKKITADIMDLYDRLLPSAESDDRRHQLVRKLEKLFNDQWPGHEIKANVFGSSGNKLCSSDSDGTFLRSRKGPRARMRKGFYRQTKGS
jgi:DNA polymerase sigma